MSIGLAMRWAREAAGMTQQELAGIIGVHRTWLFRMEKGDREVGFSDAAAVAEACGLSIDRMLLGNIPEVLSRLKACKKRKYETLVKRFGAESLELAMSGHRMQQHDDFVRQLSRIMKQRADSLIYGVSEQCSAV